MYGFDNMIPDFAAAAGDPRRTTGRGTSDEGGALGCGAGKYQESPCISRRVMKIYVSTLKRTP